MSPGGRSDLVIAGGGIGGLVAALCLARVNRTVRVLEQAPEFGEIGAGLQLAPNAARILDWLGVLDRAMKDAFFPARLVLRDALNGAEVAALRTGNAFQSRYGFPYFVTHRADLHAALKEACELDTRIELLPGKKVVGFDQEAGLVHVRCADGARFSASALIGADGIRSRIRSELIGDGEPVSTGYVAYRGTIPLQEVRDAMRVTEITDMVIWMGPAMHLVQYPVRGGDLCNQVAVFQSRRFQNGEAPWGTPEELDDVFAQAHGPVRDAARLMDRERCWPMFDRPPTAGWSRGNVTLLGDAAHPMFQYLAQGACQAMEDAVVLAQSLSSHADVHDAFRAYEATRYPRASMVQTRARMFGELIHAGGPIAALRNRFLGYRSDLDYSDADWLYDHAVLRH
jgi:2-polyprenyl-6-methoxyphenol hydroxylase-like FAD-dependent oxidoreductase